VPHLQTEVQDLKMETPDPRYLYHTAEFKPWLHSKSKTIRDVEEKRAYIRAYEIQLNNSTDLEFAKINLTKITNIRNSFTK